MAAAWSGGPQSRRPEEEGCQVRSMPAQARPAPAPSAGRQAGSREIVVTGAHGGAGTTTLAALLHTAWDMGVFRCPVGGPAIRTGGRPVVLVTRNTAAAAARAIAAVNALDGHGCPIAVLAIVSDGSAGPPAAVYRFRVLAGRGGSGARV